MRILFLGHQRIGQQCLSALLGDGLDVGLVVGHGGKDSLALLAQQHHIPFQLADKTPDAWQWPHSSKPDLIVSVYFRYLIPESMLKAPKGAINIHCSLLPAYRGCAPINWAILNGETRVGVTLHDMVATPDAGNILEQISLDITSDQQAGDVMDQLSKMASDMLCRQVNLIATNLAKRTPQPSGDFPIYPRRTHRDAVIDWSWTAERIHNLIRAVNPAHLYGGAFSPEGWHVLASQLTDAPHHYKCVPCGINENINILICPGCDECSNTL